ncbi:MAG: hypothetical protein IH940_06865 [Acidobacteria bacterium]|nr:hypothetical protein [Acidobacteriota bacterium]
MSEEPVVSAEVIDRWFVEQGLPHLIDHYSAREDILTRAAPALSVIALGEVFLVFGDRYAGWAQFAVFMAALAVLFGTVAVVNRLRGRRPMALPDNVGALEIAAFVIAPTLVGLLGTLEPIAAAVFVPVQIVILVVVYAVTSYGLVPMALRAVRQVARGLGDSLALLARALPIMLVFSLFLFINAEVWLIADDWNPEFYFLTLSALAAMIILFVAVSIRSEADGLGHFATWADVNEWSRSSPVDHVSVRDDSDEVDEPVIGRRARANVSLMLFVNHLVKVVIVVVVVFAVYVGFGLLSIRELTMSDWLLVDSIDPSDIYFETHWMGARVILTQQLLMVSGFIAMLCGVQFSIAQIGERARGDDGLDPVQRDVRRALAVRCVVRRLT